MLSDRSEIDASLPLVLVVDDDPLHREFAAGALAAAEWRVTTTSSGEESLQMLEPCPALILMDLQMPAMDGWQAVAAIRGRQGGAGSVPILAHSTIDAIDPAVLQAAGFDGFVSKPSTPVDLVTAAAAWRPDGAAAALDRLESSFGAAEIGSMSGRLRELLVEALTEIDRGDISSLAHRVAGIAGTLGFAATGEAWLALSHGDDSAREPARREARRAIAAIDRRQNDRSRSTSV